jgi:hypothetical protein
VRPRRGGKAGGEDDAPMGGGEGGSGRARIHDGGLAVRAENASLRHGVRTRT